MQQERCLYCHGPTSEETTNGDPICLDCILARGYEVCTECGRYSQFVNCDSKCPQCENREDR